MQVVEIYSPERVNKVAKEKGMKTGLSLDLMTGWNFDKRSDREMAEKYIRETKPTFVIGSPMCTMFSPLQSFNKDKGSEEHKERMRKAEAHMKFAMRMYDIQIIERRYFIHEHPERATSRKLAEVRRIWMQRGVHVTTLDQCEYGLTSKDKWGVAPAKKPTKIMTNSWYAKEALGRRCENESKTPSQRHRHIELTGANRARKAQVYPRELCEAMVEGMMRQIEHDEWGTVKVNTIKVKEP